MNSEPHWVVGLLGAIAIIATHVALWGVLVHIAIGKGF